MLPEMFKNCPYCFISTTPKEKTGFFFQSVGFFVRKSDQVKIKRYKCKSCCKTFSDATGHPLYRQRKRDLYQFIFQHLVSGYSQRRLAHCLKVNRKTIVRKFIFLGMYSAELNKMDLLSSQPCSEMQFDDLETFEHTKLKPLSVTMAVEAESRIILGLRVASMPCKGLLAKKAREKYGKRPDYRKLARQSLFDQIQQFVEKGAIIKSDQNPHYIKCVQKFFPSAEHHVYKGRRGCVVGQGELKAGGLDPLFSLNHTFAMLRANINRLFRKTWCTTKLPERLRLHLEMYILYHNRYLVYNKSV
jgi:transposase-like protein